MIMKESIQCIHNTGRVLIQQTDFIYLLPHPGLHNWISNYTITFPCAGMMSDCYAVIPHGSATLVFANDGNRTSGNLFGPITKPAYVGQQANQFKFLFIVEFQPAGYYAFSGLPQKEMTDCILPFETVNPAMNRLIEEKLESIQDINCLITEIDQLFLAHLKGVFYQPEFLLANQMILHSSGTASVKELSQNTFYSERHLNRIFEMHLGITTKSFSRLVRINKAIHLLKHRNCSLTQVCIKSGFYDVPHFIHDFKSICGITPQEFRHSMSDFYSEIAKF